MKNTFSWSISVCLLASCMLTLASCDLFKSVPKEEKIYNEVPGEIKGGKVYNPETGKDEKVNSLPNKSEMDSINWQRNPASDPAPIRTDSSPSNNGNTKQEGANAGTKPENTNTSSLSSEQLSTYEVSILLPFVTNKFNIEDKSIYKKSEWAIHYYAGTQMAADRLRSEGINLNINVLDTEGSEQKVASTLANNTALQNANLIIGPYRSVNVRQVAEFAKNTKTPLVSPFSAAARISDDNPYLIQVNPSLNTHIQQITNHILSNHRAEDVILVVRDRQDERARLALFQEAQRQYYKTDSIAAFREFIIPESEEGYDKLQLFNLIAKNGNTVFVVPSWSNEVFVNSFLRQAEIARSQYDKVTVYGMPKWKEFENTDYDYYEKLNLHISESFFVEDNDEIARNFKRNFYDRFGTRPEQSAYLGYDVMLYFGRQINQKGTQFQQFLSENPTKAMHSKFQFKPVFDPVAGMDANAPVERFENKFVHIIKFNDYRWQKAGF